MCRVRFLPISVWDGAGPQRTKRLEVQMDTTFVVGPLVGWVG